MGRKCFVPRCNTGYKSCEQKFSLFSAPKDEARLKLWRHAIPRKDRILQASDHVCERHFEPRFVSKTWTAEYNGNVLVSTPRRACLSDDAVPSIFPDCPAHLSKLVKHRKRPAVRQPACVPRQKRFHPTDSTEKAEEADDPRSVTLIMQDLHPLKAPMPLRSRLAPRKSFRLPRCLVNKFSTTCSSNQPP
ncbi:hypothetical protein HPB51_021962 [Rhipicephalus microplus]|uniref:THAP-type domain-containing protein n=1 Tax=Rhipicephalus microplus TaxID=6941 RepID=A0A9J6EIF7_RHIMP|nr:hypothetical protein HPB51_021962 [Rhipicephalus microplus]